jgi:uncharacterized membrane protein
MPVSKQPDDVAAYATDVRAALAALPDSERESLLDDLEDHLAEVASESGVPLRDRLGKPEDYAAELRSAYGAGEAESRGGRRRVGDRFRASIATVTGTQAYREARALLPELRPGWWVLRAYLAVLVVAFMLRDGNNLRPIPNPFSTFGLLEIVAMMAAIVTSVRLGRRGAPPGKARRLATLAVNGVIAVLTIPVLVSMSTSHPYAYAVADFSDPYSSAAAAGYYPGFTNIYPYTKDGKPLKDVLLYDQNGQPLMPAKSGIATDYPVGYDGQPVTNSYPLNQRHPNGDPVLPPRVALPPAPTNAQTTSSPSPMP